uniref:RRM domain-containing protein n=1 Tax=Trypanosoma congolense (strain IL3000) TaxID=1068625 RepID=G0UMT3_TRYCI|nr:conserved hypothetical protein [Trypanosoma congolense IL3000]
MRPYRVFLRVRCSPLGVAPALCTSRLQTTSQQGNAAATSASSHLSFSSEKQKLSQSSEEGGLEEIVLRLRDQLERVTEKTTITDATVQNQVALLALVQRQQAVLERRIASLEEEAVRAQQQIAEAIRISSDVALQHHSVDALVRQMEKFLLASLPSSTVGREESPKCSPNGGETSPGVGRAAEVLCGEKERGIPEAASEDTATNISAAPHDEQRLPPTSASVTAKQVSALNARIDELQVRIDQLTAEKLVISSVRSRVEQHQVCELEKAVSRAASKAVGSVAISDNGKPPASTPAKSLAAILKNTGAFPFKDSAGVTRISSQKVVVRGVPVNIGASEVRDLFSRLGAVVSCVVRPASVACGVGGGESGARSVRYRSQQHSESKKDDEKSVSTEPCAVTKSEQGRSFEVTFQTVEQAVRAVLELDGYQLQGCCMLSVEPVVSADILAAVKALEREQVER